MASIDRHQYSEDIRKGAAKFIDNLNLGKSWIKNWKFPCFALYYEKVDFHHQNDCSELSDIDKHDNCSQTNRGKVLDNFCPAKIQFARTV